MLVKRWRERRGKAAYYLWLPLAFADSILGLASLRAAGFKASAQNQSAQDQTAQTEPATNAAATEGAMVTLPAGTVISVRLADIVDSNKNHVGDQFSGTIDPSVFIANHVVIPRGTEAHVLMVRDKKGGRIHGHAEVELALTSLVMNGTKVNVASDVYRQKKGVIGAKVKGEGNATANATAAEAGDVAAGTPNPLDAGGPIIAAFHAADVKKPAGSKIDFTLTAPFTFQRPAQNAKS